MAEIFNFSTIEKKRVLEVWATQNFIKDEITGGVNKIWCIFEKTAKKFKLQENLKDKI